MAREKKKISEWYFRFFTDSLNLPKGRNFRTSNPLSDIIHPFNSKHILLPYPLNLL